ncbi:hypothetical protein DL93DRAFT_2099414 [Clavulina sp. PMI_390]|nr:hypothetical protein DL93DRAFT_2099414 [Clavulina sp. PMI_390]
MNQPATISPLNSAAREASSAVNSLLETVAGLSPSELNLTPLLLLNEAQRNDARSSLHLSLASIDSALTEVASLITTARSPLSGIRALPDEILRDIFRISVHTSYSPEDLFTGWRMALSISHTCSLWRTVSIGCSALWDELRIIHPYQMPLLQIFASRSGSLRLVALFGESARLPEREPWGANADTESIPIRAEDAKNIEAAHFSDATALNTLYFSPESLDSFSPKLCTVSFTRRATQLSVELPPYFLRATSIHLFRFPRRLLPFNSPHITALTLRQTSLDQIHDLLQKSDAPNLSFLYIQRPNLRQRTNEDDIPQRSPAVLQSIKILVLAECSNKFTHQFSARAVLPQLAVLYFYESVSDYSQHGPPEIVSLVVQHPRQDPTQMTDNNFSSLQSWVQKRLKPSPLSGSEADVSPLEELHLSEEFIGEHRGWYEANLPKFSLCQFSSLFE